MPNIKSEIERLKEEFDKEMKELVHWTMELRPEDRVGYMCFSIRQRIIQLRLKRRIANRQEQYELCAAINAHIKQLAPFLDNCRDDNENRAQHEGDLENLG